MEIADREGVREYMIWLILMVVFLLIELFTNGLATIWFAAGSLFAFLTALLRLNFIVQAVVFLAVSVILLIFTRPIALRYLNSRTTKTNAEALVGRTVRVTVGINNLKGEGQVVVNGLEWTARSSSDTVTFKPDDYVKVVGIEGVKLIVEALEKGE